MPPVLHQVPPRDAAVDAPTSFLFDAFTVDLHARRLLRDGEPQQLPSRVFDVLVHLITHRERPVQKDELIGAIWDNVVVTDDSLIHAISVLRRTLADDPQKPHYIETIPRRGYRFIGTLQSAAPAEAHTAAAAPTETAIAATATPVQAGHAASGTAANPLASTLADNPANTVAGTDTRAARADVAAVPAEVRRARVLSQLHPVNLALTAAVLVLLSVLATFLMPDTGEQADAAQTARSLRLFQTAPPGTSIVSGGTLSPDSQYLAFIARDDNDASTGLWLRSLQTGEARLVSGSRDAAMPFWSPDSTRLGFFAGGKLLTTGLHDTIVRTVATVSAAAGASWNRDDTILFAIWNNGLFTVPADGSAQPASLLPLERDARDIAFAWPQFLPDGRSFLYHIVSLDGARVGAHVGNLDTRQSYKLLDTASAATFAPPRHVLHLQRDMLIAEELDSTLLKPSGRAVVLARGLSEPLVATDKFVSASQELLAFQQGLKDQSLVWFNRDGERLGTLASPTVQFNPRLSPDGTQLLASSSVTNDPGLWLTQLEDGQVTRIEVDAIAPLWSPDGAAIAYTTRNGADILLRPLAAGMPARTLLSDDSVKILVDWTPDGSQLVYARHADASGVDLWLLDIASGTALPLLVTAHSEIQARISPDGHWIAYASDASGSMETWVARFPGFEDRQQLSRAGGGQPQWRADQRELFFLAPDRTLMGVAFDPASGPGTGESIEPYALFKTAISGKPGDARDHYAVDASGTRFLVDTVDTLPDEQQITVLVNWNSLARDAASAVASAGE